MSLGVEQMFIPSHVLYLHLPLTPGLDKAWGSDLRHKLLCGQERLQTPVCLVPPRASVPPSIILLSSPLLGVESSREKTGRQVVFYGGLRNSSKDDHSISVKL